MTRNRWGDIVEYSAQGPMLEDRTQLCKITDPAGTTRGDLVINDDQEKDPR